MTDKQRERAFQHLQKVDELLSKQQVTDAMLSFAAKEVAAANKDERALLQEVRKELSEVAYSAGRHEGFKHIMYCKYCSYASSHAHGGDCLLRRLDEAIEKLEDV